MLAVELVKNRRTKVPAKKEQEKVLQKAFKKGLVMLPGGESTIRVIPPLTISRDEFEKGLNILEDVLRDVRL
jgi:4-aminobutyrate aminotransferase